MINEWRSIQRRNVTRWEQLCERLGMELERVESEFVLNIPERLVAKMESRLDDPILRQFLPVAEEERTVGGFVPDPLREGEAHRASRLLQKYAGRALLMPTSACGVHCRYCFRRHMEPEKGGLEEALEEIANDETLREVILSGGDPLSLDNGVLEGLCGMLDGIAHLKRLRFHTRFPIGIPERIDEGFLQLLGRRRLQVWFVVHCNHPRELDPDVLEALGQVRRMGVPVLNQTVLLRGVNDDLATLKELFERLVDGGILPYYLHQLDRVAGTAHFEVEEERGHQLMGQLMQQLSGYAVPRYVREVAGEASKTLLHPLQGAQPQQREPLLQNAAGQVC
jgi:EF-P beta-lysylation protein EpmB